MIRVLLADDNALVRLCMDMAVAGTPDLFCCGTASGGAAALELVRSARPDVVVMDLSMPGMDGLQATRRILAEHPEVCVLVHSFRSDHPSIAAAHAAGARGYLLKGTPDVGVLEGIRAVHAGRRPVHDVRNQPSTRGAMAAAT
jgi:DNA-binding NarL/FixJ family response regulator